MDQSVAPSARSCKQTHGNRPRRNSGSRCETKAVKESNGYEGGHFPGLVLPARLARCVAEATGPDTQLCMYMLLCWRTRGNRCITIDTASQPLETVETNAHN